MGGPSRLTRAHSLGSTYESQCSPPVSHERERERQRETDRQTDREREREREREGGGGGRESAMDPAVKVFWSPTTDGKREFPT